MPDQRAGGTVTEQPRNCGRDIAIEPVVTTTYSLVCPVHGTVAHGLSFKEANEHRRCAMPHDGPMSGAGDADRKRGGYPSSDRPASDLTPPPKGPAPGARAGDDEMRERSAEAIEWVIEATRERLRQDVERMRAAVAPTDNDLSATAAEVESAPVGPEHG